jgi:hypothetical protein
VLNVVATPPPAPGRSSAGAAAARWVGRALVLAGAGAGIWLAGAATASADTDTVATATPVAGLATVVPEVLAVVPQAVDAVVAPVTGSPVTQSVIAVVQPGTETATSAVAAVAAPVDAAVLAIGRPMRSLVDPLLDGVLAPMAERVVAPLAGLPLQSVTEAKSHPAADITPRPVPTGVAGTVQSLDDPSPVATPSTSSPIGTLPAAPSRAPSSPSALPVPTTGAGHSSAGVDLGSADMPYNTLRAALADAGTSPEGPRPAVATAAFDPSFSPD